MNGPDTPPGRSYAGTHNSPHNRIRASALGALALVVAVIAIGMSAQIRVETNSKRDARLLNLAGRQRMLSQRIARLGVTFVPGDDTAPLKTALSTMDAEAHTLHLLTDSILDRDGAHFAPLREQLLRADSSRGNVLRVAQALAETDNDAPRLRTQLLAATEQFLPIMNSAVNSAQSFSELQVTRSIAVARTAFLVTLAVAFLLALVVVEPLVQLVKRQHEANRKHNNELRRLSSVVEQTANAVFSTDTAGIITWVNDGFVRMTGFSAAEAVGNSPRSLLQSERTDTNTLKQIYDAIEAQVGVRVALINRSKDGRDFWMDVDIRPSCDDRGTITGFLAIGIDISEEVAQRERLALIFNTVSQGVILIDTNGLIVESNPAAARILGLSTDQLHARQTVDARWGNITLSGAPMAHQDLPTSITLQTGEPVTNNVHGFRLPDGSRRWVSVNTAAVRNVREEVTSVVASFTDVTDSIEQNTRMELVVSGANLGTWDVHVPTGHATYNSNFAAMLGYMIGELSPDLTLFEQSLHPDERDGVMQALNAHLNGESAEYRMEHRLRRKDGSYAWVIGAGRVTERGIAGEPVRMVGANVDISSTKELEARADLAQQRFDAAVDGTSDGLWTWEVGGDEIWFSPRCWTLLGYTGGGPHPALTPDAFNAALHPDNADAVLQLLQDVIIHGAPCDTEIRLRVLTGEYRHFRLRCKAQRDASERTVRVAGSIQDIEKQKLAEAKLHRATMLLEDAQSVARMGSWSFDFESGLIEWSRQVFELLGRDEREGPPASANVLDDYHEDDIAQLRAAAALATTHGLPYSLVMRTRMGHRGVRYVRAEGRARSDEQGNVSGLFGTVADITSEIEREEALKQARAELEDANGKLVETNLGLAAETGRANDMAQRANHANSAKSEFLANMSHEIRTPLTAILGYADILGEQLRARTDFADSLSAVDTIRRAGEHLLIVINDVLDLSKIDAGRVIVERIETSLPSVLSDVDTFMRTRAAEKGVQLRTTFLNDLPERIYSDPTRLRQILMNLVGNAVKFTDHGSVNVRVGAGGEASPSLCIEIEDTGLGMTPSQVHSLFQPFAQADASVTRRYGGTGLGLTISRRLATLMGGDVQLDYSAPGAGSRFVLTLPMVPVAGAATINNIASTNNTIATVTAAGRSPAVVLNGRVLLAEDGEDNQRLISYHLQRAGAQVTVAANGALALRAIAQAEENGTPFDLLVTDMQMPEMDGYSLARSLRAGGNAIPIIALTAHAMAGDRQKCLDAGCNDYATKPVNRDAFLATCCEWMLGESECSLFPTIATHAALPESVMAEGDEVLRSEFSDDPDMLELVGSFIVHLQSICEQLDAHRAAGAWNDIHVVAHQLKGAAGGFGFMPITHAARDLENLPTSASNTERDDVLHRLLLKCSAAVRGWALETRAIHTPSHSVTYTESTHT